MILQVPGVQRNSVFSAPTTPYLQASTQALAKLLEDKRPIENYMKLRLKSIFEKFETLVRLSSTELSSNRWKIDRNSAFDPSPIYLKSQDIDQGRSSSSFTPLELVATAILITVQADKHSDEELLEDIKWMRHYLRARAKELRLNSNCWKLTWEFISVELNLRRAGKRPSPAFIDDEVVRRAPKKKVGPVKAKAVSRPKSNSKPRSRAKATPQPSSSSKPKRRRASPVQLGERLFPNLPPRKEPKRAAGDMADLGDTDDDEALSEYSDLSELEEEIMRLGRRGKRSLSTRDDSTETEGALSNSTRSRSSIVIEIPAYEARSKKFRLS